jgi:type I restriction enzyme M protein
MANLSFVRGLKILLPPLEEQKQIVAQIEREQSLVNSNRELIAIYEQKIKDEINQLWES